MSAEWIERAEALLSDPAAPMPEQAQLLRGQRPVILDAQAARALWLCALSAGLWWIALREPTEAEALLSPIGLLLRLLALGTSVRALSVLRSLLARLPVWARASKTALVLLDEGMLLRRPEGDIAIERDHIVRVLEAGDWSDRPSGRRFSEVFVVIRPA
ncbi:MAG: hypothetical protein OEY14_03080, partial [Myxococcales bacterium]|nr:hypothetical protein [Myxococcales bacterium]